MKLSKCQAPLPRIHGASTAGTTYENYIYDALNRVTSMTDDDSTVGFTYDTLNRVKQETQQGKLVKYTYDKLNNLTGIQYPDTRIIERTFDAINRIKGITHGTNNIASYQYAGKGFRNMSKQFGNGDAISYLYDQGKRLTTKEAKNSNNDLINKYVYDYNKINMKTFEQRVHDNNKADIFNYDALYRLKDITFNADDPVNPTTFDKKKSMEFDKIDNIMKLTTMVGENSTDVTTEVNNLNQYTQFDQWGLAHDLNGNTSQKGTQFFTYDYRNHMVSVSGEGSGVSFKYDVLGRRIEKQVSKLQVTSSRKYFYMRNQVIEERDSSDTVIKQFIYGNGIDEVLRVDRNETGTMMPYYFHTNSIGSITAITDNTGNLIERYTYDLYGMPTITDNTGIEIPTSTIGNEYLFQGRRYDKETNLYYYRARYYDPIMGRFLQTDPLGYKDSMNLYQGFNMNGVNFLDPFGLFKRKKDWKKGYAPLKVQHGDTAEKLASLIPGVSVVDVRKAVPNFIPGKEIDVSLLIDIFEQKVGKNTVYFAKKASNFIGLSFSYRPSKNANPGHLNEKDIIDLFDKNANQKGYQSGCFNTATIIFARGLIEILNAGEWDLLYPLRYEKGDGKSKISLNDLPIGTRIHFYNKIDGLHRLLRSRGEEAEWVLKIGNDKYYGFGYGQGQTIDNYEGWKCRLANTYNYYADRKISSNDVVGYYGKFYMMDYFKLVQAIFDFRNKK